MSNEVNTNAGIGFPGLLTILFIALKLTHVVAWSWLWVLSPIWITAAVFVVFLVFAILIAAFSGK